MVEQDVMNKILDVLNDADMHMKDEIRSSSNYKHWVALLIASRQHLQQAITDALKALKARESQGG